MKRIQVFTLILVDSLPDTKYSHCSILITTMKPKKAKRQVVELKMTPLEDIGASILYGNAAVLFNNCDEVYQELTILNRHY